MSLLYSHSPEFWCVEAVVFQANGLPYGSPYLIHDYEPLEAFNRYVTYLLPLLLVLHELSELPDSLVHQDYPLQIHPYLKIQSVDLTAFCLECLSNQFSLKCYR